MARPPLADIGAERRRGLPIGVLALVALVCLIAAVPVGARGAPAPVPGADDLNLLVAIDRAEGSQIAAVALRCFGLLALVPFAWFLARVKLARNPEHPRWVWVVAIVAFALTGVLGVLDFLGTRDVAREFLAAGPRTDGRADGLLDAAREHGGLRFIGLGTFTSAVLFGIWVSIASLEASRVGLITRFLGVFGIGAGIATALVPSAGFVLFLGWMGSVALLMTGWWPGGRPPAWDAGVALPWDGVDGPATIRGGRSVGR